MSRLGLAVQLSCVGSVPIAVRVVAIVEQLRTAAESGVHSDRWFFVDVSAEHDVEDATEQLEIRRYRELDL